MSGTYTYKCLNCGGDLSYDPANKNFACLFCNSSFSFDKVKGMNVTIQFESDPLAEKEDDSKSDYKSNLYICSNCGSEILTSETTAATYCYYCHNPVVLTDRIVGKYKPDKIIPFAGTKQNAIDAFRKWVKSNRFAEKNFYAEENIEKITGVYFPFWFMDSNAFFESFLYPGRKVIGRTFLNNIGKIALKDGKNRLRKDEYEFYSADFKDFDPAYLSGFQAEKRNVEKADILSAFEQDIRKYSIRLLLDQFPAYTPENIQLFLIHSCNIAWKYVLVPMWTFSYVEDNGTRHFFTMNGQTGKITGIVPVSRKKIALFCGMISLAIGLLLAFILFLGELFL